jgi:hypothetical protein
MSISKIWHGFQPMTSGILHRHEREKRTDKKGKSFVRWESAIAIPVAMVAMVRQS